MEKGAKELSGNRHDRRRNWPADAPNDYCNVASIVHTENEFVIDFHFQIGTNNQPVSRIITNPKHAKAILAALKENVEKYERQFGPIQIKRSDRNDMYAGSELAH